NRNNSVPAIDSIASFGCRLFDRIVWSFRSIGIWCYPKSVGTTPKFDRRTSGISCHRRQRTVNFAGYIMAFGTARRFTFYRFDAGYQNTSSAWRRYRLDRRYRLAAVKRTGILVRFVPGLK